MSLPKVLLIYSNGNLLAAIAAIDGIAGIVGTVNTVALKGSPKQVFSLADAESKGFTEAAEASFHRHLKEFYAEVGGNQELWIMGVDDDMTMSQMLDKDNVDGAMKLVKASAGKVRLLSTFRTPPVGYVAGINFFDADVDAALLKAKTFAQDRLAALVPLRVLIEGRVANEAAALAADPSSFSNGFAGVILGGSEADGSASIGTALGRAVKFPAHVKLGKVANGPLSLDAVFIGSKAISEVANLADLHGKGIISFMQHPNKAGFYFGIDRMASTDDFRLLVYGRTIDKAAIIAAGVYVEELEGEVDIDAATGQVTELDIEHLKGRLKQQIETLMADQISSAEVFIDPSQDVINTNTLKIKLKITPKGYTSTIEVELGLNAPSVA